MPAPVPGHEKLGEVCVVANIPRDFMRHPSPRIKLCDIIISMFFHFLCFLGAAKNNDAESGMPGSRIVRSTSSSKSLPMTSRMWKLVGNGEVFSVRDNKPALVIAVDRRWWSNHKKSWANHVTDTAVHDANTRRDAYP